MYKCDNCGAEFESPVKATELIGEYMGEPAYREIECCPFCGTNDIYEQKEE